MTTPPIDTVEFRFEGRAYLLAHDLLAEYILDKRGTDTRQLVGALLPDQPGGKVAAIAELFAAMVANNFAIETGERIPSTEEWMKRLQRQPRAWAEACDAVRQVVEKLLLATRKDLPTPPATAEPTPAVQ